jgi:hypothetical protein
MGNLDARAEDCSGVVTAEIESWPELIDQNFTDVRKVICPSVSVAEQLIRSLRRTRIN